MRRPPPLLVLALIAFFAMSAFGMTLPTLAYLAQDFGATDFQVGLLAACYHACQLLLAPVWGGASDRVGRKPMLLLGLAGFSAAFLLSSFAGSLAQLFGAQLLAGAFGSATLPSVRASVADVTSHENRARGMGLIGASIGLGFVFGPGLAFGLIHSQADLVGESLIALHRMPFRVAGGLAAAVPLLLLLLALPAGARSGAARAANPVAVFGALGRALRGPLRNVYVAALVGTLAFSSLEAALPLFVKVRFAHEAFLPASYLAKAFVVMGLVGVVVQGGIVARLIAAIGEARTAAFGLATTAVGLAIVPFFTSANALLFALATLAVGMGLLRPSVVTLISRRAVSGQGESVGALDGFESLGRAMGKPVGGGLHEVASPLPFGVAAVLATVAIVPLAVGGWLAARAPAPPERDGTPAGESETV